MYTHFKDYIEKLDTQIGWNDRNLPFELRAVPKAVADKLTAEIRKAAAKLGKTVEGPRVSTTLRTSPADFTEYEVLVDKEPFSVYALWVEAAKLVEREARLGGNYGGIDEHGNWFPGSWHFEGNMPVRVPLAPPHVDTTPVLRPGPGEAILQNGMMGDAYVAPAPGTPDPGTFTNDDRNLLKAVAKALGVL